MSTLYSSVSLTSNQFGPPNGRSRSPLRLPAICPQCLPMARSAVSWRITAISESCTEHRTNSQVPRNPSHLNRDAARSHHGNSSINGLIRFLTPKWRAAHSKDFGRRIPLFLYNYHVRGEEIIGNLRLWNRSKNR